MGGGGTEVGGSPEANAPAPANSMLGVMAEAATGAEGVCAVCCCAEVACSASILSVPTASLLFDSCHIASPVALRSRSSPEVAFIGNMMPMGTIGVGDNGCFCRIVTGVGCTIGAAPDAPGPPSIGVLEARAEGTVDDFAGVGPAETVCATSAT